MSIEELNLATISQIRETFLASDAPWLLGFSGGKDSSALLKLTYLALRGIPRNRRTLTVVYCDTGVEIPFARSLALATLRSIEKEAREDGVLLKKKVVSPPIEDRFFVKVIGRGYPPPTNKFRWCTDKLRIHPIKRLLAAQPHQAAVMLLGIRFGESPERDKTIDKYRIDETSYLRQHGVGNTTIFSPLLNYAVEDVWETLVRPVSPRSVDGYKLVELYKNANSECPIIRDPAENPCSKGRFGCWTCTVVRKDTALQNLAYYPRTRSAEHLLVFKNWLLEIRDDRAYRCRKRRNGGKGPGPFTLEARRQILSRLLALQKRCGYQLVPPAEVNAIRALWSRDRRDPNYFE